MLLKAMLLLKAMFAHVPQNLLEGGNEESTC